MTKKVKEKILVTGYWIETVKISDLQVDYEHYQRTCYPKSKKISEDFQPLCFGIPLVGKRPNNSMWIVDGAHRTYGAEDNEYTHMKVLMFESTGHRMESKIWKIINNDRQDPSAIQKFKAMFNHRDRDAVAVYKACKDSGFIIELNKKPGLTGIEWPKINCVATLLTCHRRNHEIFDITLQSIAVMWKEQPDACREFVISGLFDFFCALSKIHKGVLPYKAAQRKLAVKTAHDYVTSANDSYKVITKASGWKRRDMMYNQLAAIYNKNMTKAVRLPLRVIK